MKLSVKFAGGLKWGTYGKGVIEAYLANECNLPPIRYVYLRDCETEHLEAIQRNLSPLYHGVEGVILYGLATQVILDHRRTLRWKGGMLCKRLLGVFSRRSRQMPSALLPTGTSSPPPEG